MKAWSCPCVFRSTCPASIDNCSGVRRRGVWGILAQEIFGFTMHVAQCNFTVMNQQWSHNLIILSSLQWMHSNRHHLFKQGSWSLAGKLASLLDVVELRRENYPPYSLRLSQKKMPTVSECSMSLALWLAAHRLPHTAWLHTLLLNPRQRSKYCPLSSLRSGNFTNPFSWAVELGSRPWQKCTWWSSRRLQSSRPSETFACSAWDRVFAGFCKFQVVLDASPRYHSGP